MAETARPGWWGRTLRALGLSGDDEPARFERPSRGRAGDGDEHRERAVTHELATPHQRADPDGADDPTPRQGRSPWIATRPDEQYTAEQSTAELATPEPQSDQPTSRLPALREQAPRPDPAPSLEVLAELERPPGPLPPMYGNTRSTAGRLADLVLGRQHPPEPDDGVPESEPAAEPVTAPRLEVTAGPERPPTGIVARRGPAQAWAVHGSSHRGFRRKRNEDSMLSTPTLIAVADGVGGGPAGDVASRLAVAAVEAALGTRVATPEQLGLATHRAAAALFGAAHVDPELDGMATTLEAAVLGEAGAVHGVHIGDGSVWLVPVDAAPRLLTTPQRGAGGILEHALTTDVVVEFATWRVELVPGDRLVIATDGFFGPPHGHRLAQRQLDDVRDMPAHAAADALVRAALGAGGRDNITVVVADLR